MKFTLVGLLTAFCLSAFAGPGDEIAIPYEKFTLGNGLRVIVHEDRKAPVVAVSMWYHVGSKNEKPGKTGFAHLFEHLMFNGSENYNDEYFKPFDQVGATDMNGTTWLDRTNYFQTVPTPALELALWMESDRMGHLLGAVDQDRLDEQRAVVQNEKRQYDNQPYGTIWYHIQEGLFPEGHPYHWSTIGSMEDLNAASLDDVKHWFETWYGAANAVLVLAGDIDARNARPLVEKYFGDVPAGPPVGHLATMVPEVANNITETLYDRVPQARVLRNWAVPGYSSGDAALLEVAAFVLGSGKNSRLYRELVQERQLAVDVSASIDAFELASVFNLDVTLKNPDDVDTVNAIIDRQLAEFIASGPTKDEVLRARNSIRASAIRGLEKVGGYSGKAAALAEGELYAGDPGFIKTSLTRIRNSDRRTVGDAARKWLGKNFYQLDVLPFANYSIAKSSVDRSHLPTVTSTPDLAFPQVQRSKLKNGMPVLLAHRTSIPVVNISLQFDAGYAADQGNPLGTAAFSLAMLNEGTKTLSALQISAEAERLGAVINTESTLDTSVVELSALNANLAESVDLMADLVRNPAFKEDDVERLRPRWLANIAQEKSDPVNMALRTLPPLLFGEGHAYGIPLTGSGTVQGINSLRREDLQLFHRNWIRPDNGTLVVVGNTSMEDIMPLLERAYGNWKPPTSAMPRKNIAKVELPKNSRVVLIDKPGAVQTVILAGNVAPPTGVPNDIAIDTMNDVLGGQFTSRINMNLREDKGWSYGTKTFMRDASGQRAWISYAPVQTDKTVAAIRELQREFSNYLDNSPATKEEIDKVVTKNVRQLPGEYEASSAVMDTLLSNLRFGRPDDYAMTLKQQYQSVTGAQVQEAAHQVLHPSQLVWVIVGDRAKIEQGIRDLSLGDLEVRDKEGNPAK